ncbi:MAG: NUDIX hydrolase [Desulfobacterales bacterium]
MSTHCMESKLVHEGRVFALRRDRVTLPNGIETTLDVIRHPGAAAIVPVTASGHILLIRQYRYAIDDTIWEIPAGTIETGESPLACAQRELGEEIGVRAARWHELGRIAPLPAYSDETIHLFRAEELQPVKQNLDPDEILETQALPFDEILAMIRSGAIRDAKTIAASMLLASR